MAKPDPASGGSVEFESWPLVVWAARLSVYFLAQGALVLLADAYYGFGRNPDNFALGFRIDPILAALNLLWGLLGTYIGFFRPSYATAFVLAFAAFYTGLASLGSFTTHHFGMLLNDRVNQFHWVVVAIAWAVGLYALWHKSRPR
jgi:hypothetical protein